jgi:RNA polymerase sigma factor (sigma-70 family)
VHDAAAVRFERFDDGDGDPQRVPKPPRDGPRRAEPGGSPRDPAWLLEEGRWLEAFRRGDGQAFARLFEAYAEPLYRRVLLPRLGDPAAAEDALAETFRKLLERPDAYQDRGGGLWPYLCTVASNLANDAHRRRARSGRALASLQALLAPLAPSAAAAGPEIDVDGPRLRAAIDRVLGALNPRYARAITLRLLEERPREACAALLQVKLGTFDVLLLRALRAFRARWHELEGAPPEGL